MFSFFYNGYIVIFYGIYLNMSQIGLSSLEPRMKILSPDCYNFKKLSVLAHTIRSLCSNAYLKGSLSRL